MIGVELSTITKTYDGKNDVINNIDVKIHPGEFFVLVGPSGCGKSTILRMIAGLENVSNGSILIDGIQANDIPPSKRNLSMVFQNYALYPHLTVEQNIMFGLHTKKLTKAEQRHRCENAAEMLGLSQLLKRKPRELSGGQRQRIALARAIVTQSPICLMDEPLSNLDAKLRIKMRSEIRQLQRKLGITMIYVTHDQTEAMTMADRMMILHDGSIQQIGTPLTIYNNPNNTFVASFIGSPPMNLATATIQSEKIYFNKEKGLCLNSKSQISLLSGTAIVGVRPEHIQLSEENKDYFWVEVENVEMLGTETLIFFSLQNGVQWVARLSGQRNIKVGQKIPLTIKQEHLHFFHEETGRCVYPAQKNHSLLEEAAL